MVALIRALALVTLAGVLPGCVQAVNGPLAQPYDAGRGYRYGSLSGDGRQENLMVILAFSGGGTRAAALSFGVLEALRATTYASPGGPRRLLDDVDVISSVSGGSFTAAYYALFREKTFDDFPEAFLHRNIERELVGRLLWPSNWFRLPRADFDRINLAAQLYDETVFHGRTFGDLLTRPRRPFIIVNATDMSIGRRFEFTQDQFDLLCSDLSKVKVATAVAASSAFPGLLSPLTLQNFAAEGCGYTPPDWLRKANDRRNPPPRYLRARDLMSYQEQARTRPWIHLLDGGLADNIGLRGPYVALSTDDSSWSVLSKIDQRTVNRVVVISVNAKTKSRPDWDQRQAAPGLFGVLGLVTTGPLDNYSFDTVQLIRDFFTVKTEQASSLASCRDVLQATCQKGDVLPVVAPVVWHPLEISFDGLDDKELRECMEGLPTSFTLPVPTVKLLRQVARELLDTSDEFGKLMKALDPTRVSAPTRADRALQAEVCGAPAAAVRP
jgi:NTE family protein